VCRGGQTASARPPSFSAVRFDGRGTLSVNESDDDDWVRGSAASTGPTRTATEDAQISTRDWRIADVTEHGPSSEPPPGSVARQSRSWRRRATAFWQSAATKRSSATSRNTSLPNVTIR